MPKAVSDLRQSGENRDRGHAHARGGGQNVNKVSNAVHLRFDVPASSPPNAIKERLLSQRGRHITLRRRDHPLGRSAFTASTRIAMTRWRDCKISWTARPLRDRLGQPGEIANATLFLASDVFP